MLRLVHRLPRVVVSSRLRCLSTAASTKPSEVMPPPQFEGVAKAYSPKITTLVEQISLLTLLEVSDLNELLKQKLNIKDVPMMSYGGGGGGGAAVAPKEAAEDVEAELPKAVKTSFKLKLVKFDPEKKIALIKEVKALGDNMNLVQAKKFIESVPQVFRDNITKEEVEKLKAQLEKAGATCEIE